MKKVSEDIQAALQQECLECCDLYTITLATGAVLRYASYDKDVTYDGAVYTHNRFLFRRERIKLQGQPAVDTLGITIYAQPDDKLLNTSLLSACHAGQLEDSTILLSKAYFSDGECIGIVPVFCGRCEVSSAGGLSAKINAKSEVQGLAALLPVRMFAPQAAYTTVSGVVTVSSTDTTSMLIPLKPSGNVLLKV